MVRLAAEHADLVLKNIADLLVGNMSSPERLHHLWKTMVHLEASVLATQIRNTIGDTVYSGPFRGMQLIPDILVDSFAPILLGTYEHELHPAVEAIIQKPFQTLLNIGCGYGYYSVGLARRMPSLTVYGFDINVEEQRKSQNLALRNGVQDRVHIAGAFQGEDYERYAKGKTLVIMDIEGAEDQLLNPVAFPALQKMDILVELHDLLSPGMSARISQRFAATHTIDLIPNQPTLFDLAQLVPPGNYIDPANSFIATWERRDGPTPWAVMTAKSG